MNCTGRCLPCHWCRMEENVLEQSKKKEREREGGKKSGLFISVGGLLKDRIEM